MANVKINGVTYPNPAGVDIPKDDGSGTHRFYDNSNCTATAADVKAGKKFGSASGEETGTLTTPTVTYDSDNRILSIS